MNKKVAHQIIDNFLFSDYQRHWSKITNEDVEFTAVNSELRYRCCKCHKNPIVLKDNAQLSRHCKTMKHTGKTRADVLREAYERSESRKRGRKIKLK